MPFVTKQAAISIQFDPAFLKRFRKLSLIVGVLLVIVGLAGAAVPQIMSLVVVIFLGWLLICAGILSAYLVFLSRGRSMIAWLKPVLLALIGTLFLMNPAAGVATLALLLSIYLLLDAFGGLGLAHDLYPHRGWGWMAANGVMSLILAAILLFGWPVESPTLVGIFLGLSLAFDGLALVLIGLLSASDEPSR
ncbi:MAG TPA: hypothetical protein ENH05_08035 [Rhizobiales bacterium]|nr:acid-resistance membrane protein [bacterium BMS3Bbin10]HDO52670.1 hypothetical protein [Hyphomicrobiales bacterium]